MCGRPASTVRRAGRKLPDPYRRGSVGVSGDWYYVALNPITFLTGFRRLDRLFQLENKHGALIEAQAVQIQALQDRLTKLEARIEAREEILVAEAKGAAGSVASIVASQHVAEISRRLGAMEERTRGRGTGRLPPVTEE